MLSFVGTALFKLGIAGDLSQFWVAFEMETFDENRRHSDGIIQQTQKKNHTASPRSQNPKQRGQKWLLSVWWQESEMSGGRARSYATWKVKWSCNRRNKIRSMSGLACPIDKGCYSKYLKIHMSRRQSPFLVDYLPVPFQQDWYRAQGRSWRLAVFPRCLLWWYTSI